MLLRAPLEAHLVLLQPRLRGVKLLDSLRAGRLPPLNYYRTRFDRSRDMYFSRLGRETLRGLVRARIRRSRSRLPASPPASVEAWRLVVDRLVAAAERIEARGGELVLVAFPVRGAFRRLNDEFFPRADYWDLLADAGLATLHFMDMPGEGELRLPDQSHLDAESGRRFTRWIARRLVEKGLLAVSG